MHACIDHHIFREGYLGSLIKDNEVWEFYSPITITKVRIIVKEIAEEEEFEETKAYLEDFVDSYNVYSDEDDELAEEENS